MYECDKPSFYLTHERACEAQDMTISKMKEIVDIYKSEAEEIRAINQDMQENIDGCHK